MAIIDLSGLWRCELPDQVASIRLPGTLDESGIGHADKGLNQWHPASELGSEGMFDADAPIATRLTRRCTYEGQARLSRTLEDAPPEGRRVFLEVERARCLRLLVDGREVPDHMEPSLSTPHVFEVTGLLRRGSVLTLLSDNSYPGLPHDAIVYSSAATDETQTNWNGALGYVRLRTEEPVFISAIRVYPRGSVLDVRIEMDAAAACHRRVMLSSPALDLPHTVEADLHEGVQTLFIEGLALKENVRRWEEYEGNLCELTADMEDAEAKTVTFGVRDFGDDGGRLALNGRRLFIRSEANCAVFPETGHPPMTVAEWMDILETYKAYGVNMMRFHSHCPPEAAFEAADRLGMLMQPELSHWNPRDAFESEESWKYYRVELRRILEALANHPSFVMLTLGNELWTGETGKGRMKRLMDMARDLDPTRLYAIGSNAFYGNEGCDPNSDFYTPSNFYKDMLRGTSAGFKETGGRLQGHINNRCPNGRNNYEAAMAALRRGYAGPVFGFEVGQYEVLPDFDELADFRGVTDPANLRLIRDRVAARGLEPIWKKCVEATGELALIGYREEVEACLRTSSMSGLSLLGLQDFPGQGTALVGMLNAHLRPKPFDFARPERFSAFFRQQLPLAWLERYTYEAGDALRARVSVANYGRAAMAGPLRYVLSGGDFRREGCLDAGEFPVDTVTDAGELDIPLEGFEEATQLQLTLYASDMENRYPIWVYPKASCPCPGDVYEAERLDERAIRALQSGGKVLLSPPSTAEALPGSVPGQFTTDFWSVGTFPCQSGTMGQLIDERHPMFKYFPTQFYTNWQWWPMANQRAVIIPEGLRAIVAELDSYATLRPMAMLFECACGGGKLVFSSMGLQNLMEYPEARALRSALYRYRASDEFAPKQTLELCQVKALLTE